MPDRAASSSSVRNSSASSASAAATAAASGSSVGVELAADEPADEREREAPALQVADAGEPLEVLGAVEAEATALAGGRRQQAALLVEADRVDRHVGLARPAPRPAIARVATRL